MRIEDIKQGQCVIFVADEPEQGKPAYTWEIVRVYLLSKGICLGLKRTDSNEREAYFNEAYWFEVEAI